MNPRRPRRFFIETWGCQMNEHDSQRLAGQLVRDGLEATTRAEEADVILLNSCSVREKAEQKVYSRLGEYRLLKRERPDLVIGLCGCVAQQEGQRALKRVEELDFVLGTGRIADLAPVLEARRTGERLAAVGFPVDGDHDVDAVSRDGRHKGMVTVIEGCDKRCTFCIVPTTRGPERCRPMAEILREVERLVAAGFQEIELLGQTVNHWRQPAAMGGADFADLLDAVAELPGVERLRFVTSYPRDFTPRMVAAVGRHENICPYLHLPVQSGSDRILRRMGRGYEIDAYEALVRDLRLARPGIAISTDLIVGFPGETEEDFVATLELVRRTRFSALFAFKYSPRPGVAALRLPDPPVLDEVASERLQRLLALQEVIQRELNQELVGRTLPVLVTGPSKQADLLSGRTSCHRIVHFPALVADADLGSIIDIEILRANAHSLVGRRACSPRDTHPSFRRPLALLS